jgi:hypothetical protein
MKVLLDGRSIGERFQDSHDASCWVRAIKSIPARLLLDQHDTHKATRRFVSSQKRFAQLGRHAAIHRTGHGLLTVPVTGAFGQANLVGSVLPRSSTPASLAWLSRGRQIAERCIFAHEQV